MYEHGDRGRHLRRLPQHRIAGMAKPRERSGHCWRKERVVPRADDADDAARPAMDDVVLGKRQSQEGPPPARHGLRPQDFGAALLSRKRQASAVGSTSPPMLSSGDLPRSRPMAAQSASSSVTRRCRRLRTCRSASLPDRCRFPSRAGRARARLVCSSTPMIRGEVMRERYDSRLAATRRYSGAGSRSGSVPLRRSGRSAGVYPRVAANRLFEQFDEFAQLLRELDPCPGENRRDPSNPFGYASNG